MNVSRLVVAGLGSVVMAQSAFSAMPTKEGAAQFMGCVAGPMQLMTDVKGAMGGSYEVIGTPMAKPGELFHLTSMRCLGSFVRIGKEITDTGSCTAVDADGDKMFTVYSRKNSEKNSWKVVAGTGKYEGMSAEGTTENTVIPPKRRRMDTWQSCSKTSVRWKLK